MKIPAEFEDIFRGVELTEREALFLSWITSWDDYTIRNMRTVLGKVITGQILGITPDRLRELAQADKLIGKTVYYPYAEKILEKRVSHFIIYDERRANLPPKESWFCINDDKSETFGFEDIGKTVFLTREEAESALRREQE